MNAIAMIRVGAIHSRRIFGARDRVHARAKGSDS